jgi:hypothetical protein
MKALPRARAGRSAGGIGTPDDTAPRGRARRLALRLAFVGSAACGIVLSAGAAAHADTLGSSVVSTTVATVAPAADALGSTTDAVTTATQTADPSTTVSQTVDAVTDAATSAVQQTESTIGGGVSTVEGAVDEASDTVTKTVTDTVTKTVTAPVEELPTGTIDGVVHTSIATTSPVSTHGRILVPPGSAEDRSGLRIAGVLDVRVRLLREGAGTRLAASSPARSASAGTALDPPAPSGHVPADVPPLGASPDPAPAWPPAAASTGLALALVGAILARTASGPPGGWRRVTSPTTPFFGAAIALAVERPG